MKILFIGTVEFSYKALEKIIELDSDIVGVCTKEESSFNSDYKDLTPLCKNNNIPYKYIDDINSQENIKWIKDKNPDIIFCFGWSSLIKKELLELPSMGIVGYHPAALPQNRGRHPLIWAMVLGLKKSASTFFFMEEGADDGDILSQKKFDILYEDDAQSLYDKVINIALSQIEEFIPQLQNNSYTKITQNHNLSNIWRKRSFQDGIIDFRMTTNSIYNLVRGLSKPYVGASIIYKEQEIKIWKVEEITFEIDNIEYGKVLDILDNDILVKCSNGAIKIIDHEFKILPNIGEYL